MQRELTDSPSDVARGGPNPTPIYALSRSLATISQPSEASAEAVRALRTRVMAQHIHDGRRALAVCAASLGVGCTYVATNLALALSQIGVKTLLIDGNLRRPGIDAVIRPQGPVEGLQQCLMSDDDNYSAFIQPEVVPNLSVMYAGGAPTNPQELLARDRFEILMNHCLRDYEATIVDTPPANVCADGRRVSTVVGYSLVVARRDHTRMEDLKTLIGQLQGERAKVIGTVLNEF